MIYDYAEIVFMYNKTCIVGGTNMEDAICNGDAQMLIIAAIVYFSCYNIATRLTDW